MSEVSTVSAERIRRVGILRNALLLCVALGLGLVLRGYRLSAPSLWFDEAFCWAITRFPASELIGRMAQDNNPPLYFLTLQSWTAFFGDSIVSMRGLSVLFGCLAAGGVFLFAREAYREDVQVAVRPTSATGQTNIAFVAALLVSVSTCHIIWSREIRCYAMGTALAAFSGWLLVRALRQPRLAFNWIAWGLVNLAFLYTHYYAMFSVAAQAIFIATYLTAGKNSQLSGKRAILVGAATGLGLACAGFAFWVPSLLGQRAQVQADYWTEPLSLELYTRTCYKLLFGSYNGCTPSVARLIALVEGIVVLSLLWRPRLADLYVATAIVVPIGLSAAVTAIDTQIISPQYFLFAHLYFVVAVARLVCRLPNLSLRGGAVVVLILNAGHIWLGYFRSFDFDRPGGRGAVAFLDEHRKKGEPVVTCSPLLHYSLLYYTKDRARWYIYDDPEFPLSHYRGKPLVRSSELISLKGMDRFKGPFVWVGDMESSWTYGHVQVPADWKLAERKEFLEVYDLQGVTALAKYRVGDDGTSAAR